MELKKCPFCGSKVEKIDFDSDFGFWITCENCEASSKFCDTEEEAIETWNKRAYQEKED